MLNVGLRRQIGSSQKPGTECDYYRIGEYWDSIPTWKMIRPLPFERSSFEDNLKNYFHSYKGRRSDVSAQFPVEFDRAVETVVSHSREAETGVFVNKYTGEGTAFFRRHQVEHIARALSSN